jgi:hypothetical protein
MNKVICIHTLSGRKIYVLTTEEKWLELTANVEVVGNSVSGWKLDQTKIERIITGEYPEREEYKVVAKKPYRTFDDEGLDFFPPTADYVVVYSNIDQPVQVQGEFR